MSRPIVWQVALLILQPVFSVAYLAAVRADFTAPSFLPLLAVAVLPLGAVVPGAVMFSRLDPPRRRLQVWLFGLAALEVVWAVLSLAIVGFAIAWRSG